MKIISSGYEVYESGVVYSPSMAETRFIVSEEPKMEVVVRIKLSDEKKKEIKLEILNQYSLAFDFINPSGLGYGNSTPVRVGMLNGKPFFANFHIDIKGNNEAYSLSYTFLQKEVENG